MRVCPILALLALGALCAADELPAHVLNLARIERQMTAELKRLPNYSCLETIDRYTAAQGKKLRPYDRIRINVALVDGKELYSWPGARTFDDRSLASMVNNGFVSDGDFSAMTKNIFVNRTAEITWVGAVPASEAAGSRQLLRYDFHIQQMMSGWQIRVRHASGTVGAKGSFWVDPATLDLVRLRFAAEDMPPFSLDKSLEESVEFGRVRIGDEDVLLPLSVDLDVESFDGGRARNHETFTNCRRYSVETTLSFDVEEKPSVSTATAVEEIRRVPAGLFLALRLETPLDSRHAAVGDELRAIVSRDVRFGKELILPRGAMAKGVIRRLDRHVGNAPYFEVGLEFYEAEFEGRRAVFSGKLDEVSQFEGYHKNAIGFVSSVGNSPSPGVGYFYAEGVEIRIPKGVVFTWQSEPARLP